MRRILALTILFVLLYFVPAGACTTVAVTDSSGDIAFVGKSYDWGTQAAMVVSNRAGITKRALVFPTEDTTVPTTALSWTSQIPSITFNQYGREIPTAGMNQYGLVVETMEMDPGSKYLSGTVYKPSGATEVINENQWVQYILDMFTSVDNFLAPENYPPAFAIMPDTVPIHFLICDTLQCVAVEIINNDLITTQGAALGVKLSSGEFIPVNALTNDYYECSVHGLNGDDTLALEDYEGYGGTRPIPFGPQYCVVPAENICSQAGDCTTLNIKACDQACRTSGAWYNSNSVERFVRAAAGSRALSGNNATVDDMFQLLNNVFSTDGTTGGSMWQIVYEPKKLIIHWRTVADGCNLTNGFTGAYRSIGFGDFDFGDGRCTTPDNTKVVNIDQAPSCSGPLAPTPLEPQACVSPLVTCNPIPSLASCSVSNCTISAYSPQDNHNLVAFAAENSEVNMAGFAGMIKNFLQGVTDDQAKAIMYNIWGGYPGVWGGSYPVGFTTCSGDVSPEGIVNLYLASAKGPYITPQIKPDMEDVPLNYDRKGSWGPFSYEVSGGFSGQEDTKLNALYVTKDSPTDMLSIGGDIPELKSTGNVTLTADVKPCPTLKDPVRLCPVSVTGTVKVRFPVKDFTVDMLGANVSYDERNPLCFDKEIKLRNVTFSLGGIACSADIDLGPLKILGVSADFLCSSIYAAGGPLIQDIISHALEHLGPKVASSSFPQCGDTTVAAPASPPTLTAGWGGLEGQYVTARAGHTYLLDGIVNADQESFSHEFATFSEAVPGYETTCLSQDEGGIGPGWFAPCKYVDIARMRSKEGSNDISTVWTPVSEGDTVLLFDVSRWDEQTDEVVPAILHVHVLPPGGPTSWLGLTKEGLSTKLKEVK
ncbi:MAG: hypothetical protein P8Z71_01770 [Candidatus Sulfobium sp.]